MSLEHALAYAGRGWRVVPTWAPRVGTPSTKVAGSWGCTCRNGPDCEKPGKHPMLPAWQDVATTNEAIVRGWWLEAPWANVSIATGARSGLLVVDVDPRGGGLESAAQMPLNPTLMAATGGGGYHYVYAYPEGVEIRNRGGLLPGIDVRGEGGQIVAAPSLHARSDVESRYMWMGGDEWWVAGPQLPCPELVALLLGPRMVVGDGGGVETRELGDLPPAAEILAGVAEGERNDTLFRWACQLRRQLKDDRVAVETLVRQAGRASGLDGDEVSVILWSAFNQDHEDTGGYGVTEAQLAWAREAETLSRDGVVSGVAAPSVAAGLATGGLAGETGSLALPLTDDGNSLRFIREFGSEFRFVPQSGMWLRWDGSRWAECQVLEEETAATTVARGVWREVADIEDSDTAKLVERWAKSSQMRHSVRAQLDMVKPKLAVAASMLDADDWLLNVANGTLDLRSGTLREHDRRDLLTQIVDTPFVPAGSAEARCDAWWAFLEMVLPDPNVRWFVQKAVGYSLTGVTDAKALFILYGAGSNGKSVFLEALRENVIGGYGGVAPKTLVMMERDEHATQLAGMAGKRFVTLSEEVEERDRLRTSTLKSITGGDEMTARFMRQDFFTFVPKLKMWIATNHKPGIAEFGEAMKTRLRLVPFTETIPVDRRRPREAVLRDFRAERSGLLAWAVQGLAGWLQEGLEPPSAMVGAVEEWFSDEDVFGQWVDECGLRSDPGSFMTTTDLHAMYTFWMAARGEERYALSNRSMGKRMLTAGFRSGKHAGKRGWFVTHSGVTVSQNGNAPY